jgi:hypothetical protein
MTAITSSRDNDLNDKGSSRELPSLSRAAETYEDRNYSRVDGFIRIFEHRYPAIRDIARNNARYIGCIIGAYREGWLFFAFPLFFHCVIFRGARGN